MEIKELAKKVQDMRNAQSAFFKSARTGNQSEKQATLQLAKKLESEIDKLVREVLNPTGEPLPELPFN